MYIDIDLYLSIYIHIHICDVCACVCTRTRMNGSFVELSTCHERALLYRHLYCLNHASIQLSGILWLLIGEFVAECESSNASGDNSS